MKTKIFFFVAIFICSFANAREVSDTVKKPVTRRDLLTAMLAPGKQVSKVEIQEITMEPGVEAPLHLHPCPTMGVILEGVISFQIEGQPVRYLKAGDAFYEPADVRVAKFNNDGAVPAKFAAFYLLGENEQETIHILDR